MAVKEKALKRLAEKMNAAGLTWAIGGDFLMAQRGLPVDWHGFELMTTEQDIPKADKILTRLGMKSAVDIDAGFAADYHFDGADIRLLSAPVYEGCRIRFDASSIAEDITVFGVPVHCMYTEDWLVISALQGRASLSDAIAASLKAQGIAHPDRFAACVDGALPEKIAALIAGLQA